MHFCTDELFVIMMAVQNGPRNIWRFIVSWATGVYRRAFPKKRAFDRDMRTWQQSQDDLREMKWSKEEKRWTKENK